MPIRPLAVRRQRVPCVGGSGGADHQRTGQVVWVLSGKFHGDLVARRGRFGGARGIETQRHDEGFAGKFGTGGLGLDRIHPGHRHGGDAQHAGPDRVHDLRAQAGIGQCAHALRGQGVAENFARGRSLKVGFDEGVNRSIIRKLQRRMRQGFACAVQRIKQPRWSSVQHVHLLRPASTTHPAASLNEGRVVRNNSLCDQYAALNRGSFSGGGFMRYSGEERGARERAPALIFAGLASALQSGGKPPHSISQGLR